ncbi:hypothetical protein [Methylobacterium sp. AMS5]|nr:hypothetical protein [Methylobacterium sp. AMS5]AMB45077.1 hypothetical protein Y590_09215 [Methylobacterium sp. AMS5]
MANPPIDFGMTWQDAGVQRRRGDRLPDEMRARIFEGAPIEQPAQSALAL